MQNRRKEKIKIMKGEQIMGNKVDRKEKKYEKKGGNKGKYGVERK